MSNKSVSQELLLKPGHLSLLVNPPLCYRDGIGAIPDGVTVVSHTKASVDAIQVFVTSQQQLELAISSQRFHLKPGGILWATYRKGTLALASDVNRQTM